VAFPVIYIEFPWKPKQGMQISDQGKTQNRTGMAMRNEWFDGNDAKVLIKCSEFNPLTDPVILGKVH
jgi:hypothetical protein